MRFEEENFNVALHLHLDGAARVETLYDLAKISGTNVHAKNVDAFSRLMRRKTPTTLKGFLKPFPLINSLFAGNKEAVIRVCTEFVEDCANLGKLCYVEARYLPHQMSGPEWSPESVVETILEVFQRVGQQHGVEVRTLLTMLRSRPEQAEDILQLAKKYKPHGVVGIDVAGDDGSWFSDGTDTRIVKTFQQAKLDSIHRTVHAGENGPASSVYEAMHKMHAERIGHGYHVLDSPSVYEDAKSLGVHFEVCPVSSYLTSSVPEDFTKHAVHQFLQDKVTFSINTDCPLISNCWDVDEAKFCRDLLKLTEDNLRWANLCAAKAAFLDNEEERQQLIEHLMRQSDPNSIHHKVLVAE